MREKTLTADEALTLINQLRSNVIGTQRASWSNQVYPLVAILDAAGYEVHGITPEAATEHQAAYHGAGHWPTVLTADVPYSTPHTMGDRFDNVVVGVGDDGGTDDE